MQLLLVQNNNEISLSVISPLRYLVMIHHDHIQFGIYMLSLTVISAFTSMFCNEIDIISTTTSDKTVRWHKPEPLFKCDRNCWNYATFGAHHKWQRSAVGKIRYTTLRPNPHRRWHFVEIRKSLTFLCEWFAEIKKHNASGEKRMSELMAILRKKDAKLYRLEPKINEIVQYSKKTLWSSHNYTYI